MAGTAARGVRIPEDRTTSAGWLRLDSRGLSRGNFLQASTPYVIRFTASWRPDRYSSPRSARPRSVRTLSKMAPCRDGAWNHRGSAFRNKLRSSCFPAPTQLGLVCNAGICVTAASPQTSGSLTSHRIGDRAWPINSAIKHIVQLMLENRSFDQMLGFLYTANGNRSPTNQPYRGPDRQRVQSRRHRTRRSRSSRSTPTRRIPT